MEAPAPAAAPAPVLFAAPAFVEAPTPEAAPTPADDPAPLPIDPEADAPSAGAMHAWMEVYLPGGGWKGMDPTHGIWCDDAFIPVAHAAVAESINPIQGSYYHPTPVHHELSASVLVEKSTASSIHARPL